MTRDYLAKRTDFKLTRHETPRQKTINGIVHLSEERQLYTLKQASDPDLIKGIANKTTYTEVKMAALAHKNYPQDSIRGKTKKVEKKN